MSIAEQPAQPSPQRAKAPISGTILDRSVEKGELLTGQFASSARPVFSLANLDDIQADLDVAQDDFSSAIRHCCWLTNLPAILTASLQLKSWRF